MDFNHLAGICRNKRSAHMPTVHFDADHPFIFFVAHEIDKSVPIFYGTLQSITTHNEQNIDHDEL